MHTTMGTETQTSDPLRSVKVWFENSIFVFGVYMVTLET